MIDSRKAARDARPRCKATSRNGAPCTVAAGADGICKHHARVVARGRTCGLLKPRRPCGSCPACDEARFAGWLKRIEAGLPTDTGEGFWPRLKGEETTPRELLAAEIRDDMAKRHPFGVAVRLGAVICALAAHDANEDRDAVRDLEDLISDEEESQALNGSSVTCAAWAKQADERHNARQVRVHAQKGAEA